MNVGELIGEIHGIEINTGRARQKRDLAGRPILRGTIDEAHFWSALSWEKMVVEGWGRVRAEAGAERVLAVCRDEFGDAASETLKRLRDRLSIRLDCEPASISAMTLLEFIDRWKGNSLESKAAESPNVPTPKKGIGRPAQNEPRITINAKMLQELSRNPEGDCWNWGLRDWQQKLGCKSTSAVSKTAAWKAIVRKRELQKESRKSKSRSRYDD